ncbi:unnamed protein product [Echinostoma caproni]|uniref:H15 domain-containing protein n=1 Tax=Echinostoma caproni TaxID=27848 RepID=A0A183AWD4_9TREM|nr:unnamed protein product [Echinostoma caproni]
MPGAAFPCLNEHCGKRKAEIASVISPAKGSKKPNLNPPKAYADAAKANADPTNQGCKVTSKGKTAVGSTVSQVGTGRVRDLKWT